MENNPVPFRKLSTAKRPALDTRDYVNQLQSSDARLSPVEMAKAIGTLQDYCDALGNQLQAVSSFLSKLKLNAGEGVSITGTGAEVTITNSGNTYLTANCSSQLVLTTSYADVSGCSITVTRTGYWLFIANVAMSYGFNNGISRCQLLVNGSAQTGVVLTSNTANGHTGMFSRSWVARITSGQVAKLQGKKDSGVATSTIDATDTTLVAIFLRE